MKHYLVEMTTKNGEKRRDRWVTTDTPRAAVAAACASNGVYLSHVNVRVYRADMRDGAYVVPNGEAPIPKKEWNYEEEEVDA